MRIVLMGTPAFAIPSLGELIRSTHEVAGVVTQPDRPRGRGLRLGASPVKAEAQKEGLFVLQPEDLNDPEFLESLGRLRGECFVVVGFRILPPAIFEMPPKGTVNLHASLLPQYRGAAPIQWAIINGEKKTGVSTFFIQQKVDTGDLILQEEVSIGEEETAGELHDRLAELGARLLLRAVDLIAEGCVTSVPQRGIPTPAPKIQPDHCRIDWNQTAIRIVNLVRGLSPYPGAFTFWNGKRIKVYRASVGDGRGGGKPGEIVRASDEGIVVQTGDGTVCIRELQVEGKKRISAAEFLRGYGVSASSSFGQSL